AAVDCREEGPAARDLLGPTVVDDRADGRPKNDFDPAAVDRGDAGSAAALHDELTATIHGRGAGGAQIVGVFSASIVDNRAARRTVHHLAPAAGDRGVEGRAGNAHTLHAAIVEDRPACGSSANVIDAAAIDDRATRRTVNTLQTVVVDDGAS